MSSFELKLDLDNDAFAERAEPEIERIFRRVIERLETGDYLDGKHMNILDINGNTVGTFKIVL